MTDDTHDVVKVYAGPVVNVELYQQALRDVGIESKVAGLELSAGIGSALPNAVELWVKGEDAEKAAEAIKRFEADKGIMA